MTDKNDALFVWSFAYDTAAVRDLFLVACVYPVDPIVSYLILSHPTLLTRQTYPRPRRRCLDRRLPPR